MAALISGQIVQLSPLVRRLLAPNPGPFTGPGTNTYIVGQSELAIIDPGPELVAHTDVLLDELGDSIRWILVTHTHRDHSPAARLIKERLGSQVQVIGMVNKSEGFSFDQQFEPNAILEHGQAISNGSFTLRAIHTPGHASNHLCFFLEEESLLFSGDHLMDGSTVVIAPPDGNMADYLDSLSLLLEYPIDCIAPAHGNLITDAQAEIEKTINHRLGRESKVLAALVSEAPCLLADLVPLVYDDVPAFMHPIAQQSLLAHLIKLKSDKRAAETEGRWGLS